MDDYGIAAIATSMNAASISMQASYAVMNKVMDSQEVIADQLIDALASLDVGYAEPSRVDISV